MTTDGSAASPHEHVWPDIEREGSVLYCECGAMLAHGQVFYPAWEWLSTAEGTVTLEHPVGEAVRKIIEGDAMPDLLPGFWCPTCEIGWFEKAQPKCVTPLDHFRQWVNSPRSADNPEHSVTHDDQ